MKVCLKMKKISDDVKRFISINNLNLINDRFILPQICKLNDKNITNMYFIINNRNSSINSKDTIIINLKDLMFNIFKFDNISSFVSTDLFGITNICFKK